MVHIPRAVLDCLPNPVMLLDKRRTVVEANRAAREIFDALAIGRDLAIAVRHPSVLGVVDRVLANVGEEVAEAQLPLPVPRTFVIHAVGMASGDSDVAVALVLTDTTLTRRAEQLRADFIANASHELRSPLASVLGFVETLMGPAKADSAAQKRFLEIVHREAKRMARLLDDLFSLSRVEINEHVPPKEKADLVLVLGNATEPLAPRAAERNMEIRLDCSPGLPPVIGDSDQLIQVFRNLIENSIRYAHAGTPVMVSAREVARIPDLGGAGLAVTIVDESEGIPAEAIPRLTERFFRVDKARSQALGGTGLGLAIVKHIISRHRGRLVIESELGKGSRFTIYLPAAQAKDGASARR